MEYAVEARIFNNGRIVAKVRPAEKGEESGRTETRTCDVWVDIFKTEAEAKVFARDYKNA